MAFNFWNFEKDGDLVGFYIGRYPAVGAFQKPVHAFKLENDIIVHAWGTSHLNFKLYGIPFKSKIKIKYLGKKIEDRANYPMMIFEIEVLEPFSNETNINDPLPPKN